MSWEGRSLASRLNSVTELNRTIKDLEDGRGSRIAPYVWGLAFLDPWPTILGAALMFLGKLWFVDRMVWLYEDLKDKE